MTTGAGKSTAIKNMLTTFAYAGYGFCFIDPHNDTWKDVIAALPEHRLDDVIYIAPPTGEYDKIAALNFLDVPRYDDEPEERYQARVSKIINQNIQVIGGEEDMYARMTRVLKAVQHSMVKADENYTPLSIYRLLTDPELQEDFAPYIDDAWISDYMKYIERLEEDDLEPVIGRLDKWILDKIGRKVISHPHSSVNISEAVANGKIIIVNTNKSEVGESISKAIGTAVTQRVWSAVESRSATTNSPSERRPFFLAIDELGISVPESTPIDTMLQDARKYRLGLTLATQDPEQLAPDHRDAVTKNTNTKIVGRLPDSDTAEDLAGLFDGIYEEDIRQMPEYNAYVNFPDEDGASVPVRLQLLAPYPQLRSYDAVDRVVERSLEKYGVDPDHGITHGSTIIEQVVRGTGTVQAGTVDIDMSEYLTAIDRVELFRGATTSGEYVPVEDVAEELRNTVAEEFSTRQIEKAIVQLPDSRVATKETDAGVVVSLTDDGRAQARGTGTGDAASAGGAKHQLLVQETRNLFTRLRCDVTVPDQGFDSEHDPDAVIELPEPVEPNLDTLDLGIDRDITSYGDLTPSEFEQAKQRATQYIEEELPARLAEHHDALPVISDGNHIYVEVETSTNSKFALTLRNLRKAVADDRRCVFVVRDEGAAKQIIRGITDPAFCKRVTGDGTRYLYTGAKELTVTDDSETWTVVREKTGERTRWRGTRTDAVQRDEFTVDPTDEFVLETTSGDEVLRINAGTVEDRTVPKTGAGAWMRRDRENGVYIVRELQADGTVAKRVYETKSDFTDEWSTVTRPFVPELMFDRRPTVDDWCVVVLPNDTAADDGAEPCVFTVEDEHVARDTSGDDGVTRTPIRVAGWHGTADTETVVSRDGDESSHGPGDSGEDGSTEDGSRARTGAGVDGVDVPESVIGESDSGAVSDAAGTGQQDGGATDQQNETGTGDAGELTPDFNGVSIDGQITAPTSDGSTASDSNTAHETSDDTTTDTDSDEPGSVDTSDEPGTEDEMMLPADGDRDEDDWSDEPSDTTSNTASDGDRDADEDGESNPVLALDETESDEDGPSDSGEDGDDDEALAIPDEDFEALLDDPVQDDDTTTQSPDREDSWETDSQDTNTTGTSSDTEQDTAETSSTSDDTTTGENTGEDEEDEADGQEDTGDDDAWMW
ncbi:hypothetical protein DJ70_07115 [Halorubrum halodurans]|uniref:Uncharacterized protein n=2 Tax=Halorubrum halodurans TaxID=1383851 RepID=A0A256ILF3_9EURY|nr:hypothetical protein DJ70_07115 [Halorubrum halodurans]